MSEKPPPFCFVFVCQRGELEIEAMLLAASLRAQMGPDVDVVAAVPQPQSQWGVLSSATIGLLDELGVRTLPVWNRIDPNYAIGNKVACLGVLTPARQTVFLDSDILCLKPLKPGAFPGRFNVKPANLETWRSSEERWAQIYAHFDLPMPTRRVVATVSRRLIWPYFNAGVIALESNTDFAAVWEECCVQIDKLEGVAEKRPWLDQIALPIAAAKQGLAFHCIGDDLNFPACDRPLPAEGTTLCHYRFPTVIRREPTLKSLVEELVDRYPLLHRLLSAGEADWLRVIDSPRRAYRPKIAAAGHAGSMPQSSSQVSLPELVITGIPRSGTSLLCRLLSDLPNSVIINEPAKIYGPLRHCHNPSWLGVYYRDIRRDILEGCGIYNKVIADRMVEDTSVIDERVLCYPQVEQPGFLLGTKNTLAYLARIDVIRRAMPGAPIVACVRHPFDTIASWKGSFSHLRDADLADFPVSYTKNGFLTGIERNRLKAIAATDSAAQRRAMIWAHLADTILRHLDRLVLLRYEDLISAPSAALQRIVADVQGFECNFAPMPALELRSRRDLLDEADYEAIQDLCGPQAAELGYEFGSEN